MTANSDIQLAVFWFEDLIQSKLKATRHGNLLPYLNRSSRNEKKQLINSISSTTYENASKLVMEENFTDFVDEENKSWTLKFRNEKDFRVKVLKALNKKGYSIIDMDYSK